MLFGFLGCLVWRFILERKGLKCPGLWVRCGVGLAGLLMILGLHGTLIGLTAGMGLLLLLFALKVLEMRSEREFMLLAYLAFFILLTALFFSQSLLTCLYVFVVFVILTATVVQFTGGASEGLRPRDLLRYTVTLVAQALPIVLLFFFFLPRMKGGATLQLSKSDASQSGMSDQINPGSFSELALNDEIAFRADFPEGNIPPYNSLYWRVAVFTECHGLAWRSDKREREVMAQPILSGPLIVQRISMEPHAGSWVYALDRPLLSNGPVYMSPGNVLTMNLQSNDRINIRVTSQLGNDRSPLSDRAKRVLTTVPEDLSERSRDLVNDWLRQTRDPRQLVNLALNLFRKEKFGYTLTPGNYGKDGLDTFLFERRLGFCEHYAAAFATLMRMAGLPARIVGGYHGGEANPFSDYLIVRQADAHAWGEVWIEGEGWVRFDPVDSINPLLIDQNTPLASRFPTQMAGENEQRSLLGGSKFIESLARSARLGWDTVNFQWNLHIVSYDQSSQRDFYSLLGIKSLLSWKLLSILLGGLFAVLAAVYFTVRQRPPKKNRALLVYHDFCRFLAKRGLPRDINEGPMNFANRASIQYPEIAGDISSFNKELIAVRYGSTSAETRQLERSLSEFKRNWAKRRTKLAKENFPERK